MKPIQLLFLFLSFTTFGLSQITLDSTTLSERTVVSNLDVPWDMTYGPDGWIWFTEVAGDIHRFHPDTEELEFIFTIPDVNLFGFGAGLHSIVLHPDFLVTPYIYVHYLNSKTSSKIVRYTYDAANNTLIEPTDILTDIIGAVSHNGSRMIIIDSKLFIPIGDGFNNPDLAQGFDTNNGKFLRLNLDGSVPDDNPITDSYIWSWGHRNPQGFCVGKNGILYSSEHGTAIDDEINIIHENRNYGWPEVEGFCDLESEIAFCESENVVEPIWAWTPAIAPCGLEYFDHPSIPEWQNSLLLVTLKAQQFIQLKLSEDGTSILEENNYLIQTYGRLRDVLVLPDGRIFICTTNHDFFGNPSAEDDRIIEIKNDNFTALKEMQPDINLTLYPNPTNGEVSFNGYGNVQLFVLDMNGKVILEKQLDATRGHHFSTIDFPDGLYIVRVFDGKRTFMEKLVVSK